MIVYLNGRWLDARQAAVSVWDGGYLYGDGVYTTLRLYGGRPLDLAAHHRRLVDHAASLDLAVPVDLAGMQGIVRELAIRNDLADDDGRLRLTVSRGGDPERPLPLDELDRLPTTLLATLAPLAPDLAGWQRDGIPVIVLPAGFARGNLPALKTLNGLTTVLALRRAARAGCPDALLTGEDGRLLEGAVSNLFLVDGDTLRTPGSADGLLAGRTRQRVLDLAGDLGLAARRETLMAADLGAADEAFLASSVREILPVVKVDGRPVGTGRPGRVTQKIQVAYSERIRAEIDR